MDEKQLDQWYKDRPPVGDLGKGYFVAWRSEPYGDFVPFVVVTGDNYQEGLELTPERALKLLAWLEQHRDVIAASMEQPS